MKSMIEQFNKAKLVSTPVISIATVDPAATMTEVAKKFSKVPIIRWDLVNGLSPVNELGVKLLEKILAGKDPVEASFQNLTDALVEATKFPRDSILFVCNAHRYLPSSIQGSEAVSQAIWNLRDKFKENGRTLVLLSPGFTLPVELQQDITVIAEELPSEQALMAVVEEQFESAQLAKPSTQTVSRCVDAVRGLSLFQAEQTVAMSLNPELKENIDFDNLWAMKRQMIQQTPGLSCYKGTEKFQDIGGVENIKKFLSSVAKGQKPPKGIVFIDEIEKALAGSTGPVGDSSGVSQGFLGALLSYMQDTGSVGAIFVGPAGTAKSAVAKAIGNEAGIETIIFDLNGMKASLVGESEANIRAAFKVVSAITNDATLFIATCNKISDLPPELRRRFSFGTFFFDLPSSEERKLIWNIYIQQFKLNGNSEDQPDDDGWTGAEIKTCCDLAYRLQITLKQAAEFIVPVSISASDAITQLRQQASGKFISASYTGPFLMNKIQDSASKKRQIKL